MYYVLYTYPGIPNSTYVLKGSNDKTIVAAEGNQYLLVEIAQKLKDENVIASFNLVKEVE